MRVWIFGAVKSNTEDIAFCKRLRFAPDDLIICADGGYDVARFLGITPDVVIGDMDSVKEPIFSGVKKITHPPNKDKTDLHLCIDYALENGCGEIILLCCFGGRVDHTIAALITLRYIMERGAEGMLLTKKSKVFLTTGKAVVKRGEYTKLSIIPVTETASGVTTDGLHYALVNATLRQTDNLGISNTFADTTATIEVSRGILCIACEND